MEEIKILELFGGIGALTKAFKRLEILHKVIDYVEIDKYAVASYNAINGTSFEPQDICKWDKDIKVDLIMHGSPCQDFSLAGKQAGGDEGSGTRSSLMYETIRIVDKLKPKYVIWENVKNLLSKKHRHNFDAYLETMEQLGYNNYYQVLNAKDYGIPQNRERVFTISIRKDINKVFTFPQAQELKLKLKDMLEDEVDEKYYLSDRMTQFFIYNEQQQKEKGNGFRFNVTDGNVIAKTITTRAGGRMDDNFIGNKELYIKNATKKGYQEAYEGDSVNLQRPTSTTRRGRVGDQVSQTLQTSDNMGVVLKSKCRRLNSLVEKTDFEEGKVLNMDLYNQTTNENISQTLTDPCHNTQRLFDGLRIRKLTPKECWRLMGFDDEDVDKAAKVNSNTQLYKQAGNSIVVNVLEVILTNLLLNTPSTNPDVIEGQLSIYDLN
jgi:DNA (cytosine-5)-methyltransferase 1